MSVSLKPATTPASDIDDLLPELTDGVTVVIAVEIFDHPDAILYASVSAARRHGVDPGSGLGVWAIGPRDEVYAWLDDQGFEDYSEQYSAGYDGEA